MRKRESKSTGACKLKSPSTGKILRKGVCAFLQKGLHGQQACGGWQGWESWLKRKCNCTEFEGWDGEMREGQSCKAPAESSQSSRCHRVLWRYLGRATKSKEKRESESWDEISILFSRRRLPVPSFPPLLFEGWMLKGGGCYWYLWFVDESVWMCKTWQQG